MYKVVNFNNKIYVNTTDRFITLHGKDTNYEVIIPPCGYVINPKTTDDGSFVMDSEDVFVLSSLEKQYKKLIVLGTKDSAQAYPGRVVEPIAYPKSHLYPDNFRLYKLEKFIKYSDK